MPVFMKPDGILGHDKTKRKDGKKDEGWIPLTDYHYDVQNTSHNPNHDVAGGIVANTVQVEMIKDASVVAMISKCTTGDVLPSVVIEDCNADKDMTVLGRLLLTDVLVQQVKTDVVAGVRKTMITMIYRKAKWDVLTPDDTYQDFEYSNTVD